MLHLQRRAEQSTAGRILETGTGNTDRDQRHRAVVRPVLSCHLTHDGCHNLPTVQVSSPTRGRWSGADPGPGQAVFIFCWCVDSGHGPAAPLLPHTDLSGTAVHVQENSA